MTVYYNQYRPPEYQNLKEMERKMMQKIAEQIDRMVMDFDIPGQKTGVMVLDAETAANIEADDIECEIINDKPIAL